jgi:hypothetical protein
VGRDMTERETGSRKGVCGSEGDGATRG